MLINLIKKPVRVAYLIYLFISKGIKAILCNKRYAVLKKHTDNLEQVLEERLNEIFLLNKELISKNEELYTVEQSLNIQWESIEDLNKQLIMAQEKLVHTEKMASLGVLIAGIAHEINNPLNFINTGIIGLKENIDDLLLVINKYKELNENNIQKKLPEIHDFENSIGYQEVIELINKLLKNINMGVGRLVNIVNGLRIFASSDKKELSTFNIHQYIDNTLLILHNKYKNRINIEKKYDNLPEIEGYSGKISQVFMNILSNSVEAIENKGTIAITTKLLESSQKLSISIKDTGKGIPECEISRIFDPFYTTKLTGEGMGLGLSITYSIIKEHKGDIEVKSKLDIGTEFIITLPLKQ